MGVWKWGDDEKAGEGQGESERKTTEGTDASVDYPTFPDFRYIVICVYANDIINGNTSMNIKNNFYPPSS